MKERSHVDLLKTYPSPKVPKSPDPPAGTAPKEIKAKAAISIVFFIHSEKDSTHPPTRNPLSLVQDIVLVYELHEVIAAFLYTAHEGHECCIVALFVELRLEEFRLQDGQASS